MGAGLLRWEKWGGHAFFRTHAVALPEDVRHGACASASLLKRVASHTHESSIPEKSVVAESCAAVGLAGHFEMIEMSPFLSRCALLIKVMFVSFPQLRRASWRSCSVIWDFFIMSQRISPFSTRTC